MTDEHRFDCPELGFYNMTDAAMVASLKDDAAKGDTYAAACLRARGINPPTRSPAMFGTPDSAAALARTITDATSRAEPVITRIEFAPGHEDARLTSEQIAALMRKVRLAPRMLKALKGYVQAVAVGGGDDKAAVMAAIRAADNEARAVIAEAEGATSQGARG